MNGAGKWTLEGAKTALRAFTEDDISTEYLRWLNDPVVVRLSNQRFQTHDRATSLAYLESFRETDNLFVLVALAGTSMPVGTLTAYVSQHHLTADVGIMIGERSVWGQGVGLDAWVTLCNWLLKDRGLRKLTAGTLDCNYAMIRIMEKSGMVLEAVRRNQELLDGEPHDILHYARFRDA